MKTYYFNLRRYTVLIKSLLFGHFLLIVMAFTISHIIIRNNYQLTAGQQSHYLVVCDKCHSRDMHSNVINSLGTDKIKYGSSD